MPQLTDITAGIERAMAANGHCAGGLFTRTGVLAVEHGPFGGPELLALIYADDVSDDYWYAHLLRNVGEQIFISLICCASCLVSAPSVAMLFKRYHYWMVARHCYSPCVIQDDDDAYAESSTLHQAAIKLETMISRFEPSKRWGKEGTPWAADPMDTRIYTVYGLGNFTMGPGYLPSCHDWLDGGNYVINPDKPVLTLLKAQRDLDVWQKYHRNDPERVARKARARRAWTVTPHMMNSDALARISDRDLVALAKTVRANLDNRDECAIPTATRSRREAREGSPDVLAELARRGLDTDILTDAGRPVPDVR